MNNIAWDEILEYAKNAPSGGNAQPWRVEINKNTLSVLVEDSFLSPATAGYQYVAAHIAIGTLGFTIYEVALALGYKAEIHLADRAPYVTVSLFARDSKTDDVLLQSIGQRCTNRKLGCNKIPEPVIQNIMHSLEAFKKQYELENIHIALTNQKEAIASISNTLSRIDMLRLRSAAAKEDLFSEFKCQEGDSQKKICLKTLEFPWVLEKMLCLMVQFPYLQKLLSPKAFGVIIKRLLQHSSHLGLIYGPSTLNEQELVKTGIILQFLWLEITKQGYAFQPWSIFPCVFAERFFPSHANTFSEAFDKELSESCAAILSDFGTVQGAPAFIFRLHDASSPVHRSSKHSIPITYLKEI